MNIDEKLNEIINEISIASHIDDLWYILCKISFTFENENINEINANKLLWIFLNIIETTFKNEFFYKNIEKVIRKRATKDIYNNHNEFVDLNDKSIIHNDEFLIEKKTIRLFFNISFFCVTLFLWQLSEIFIKRLRFKLIDLSKYIEEKSNYTIDYWTMMDDIVWIMIDPKFWYNDTFPLKKLWVKMWEQINSIFLFETNKKNTSIIITSLISFPYFRFISSSLKNIHGGILNKLNNLYGASAISEKRINRQIEYFKENNPENTDFYRYTETFRTTNEKITWYIIEKITSWFYDEDKNPNFNNKLAEKIDNATEIKNEITNFCTNRLSAFGAGKNDNNERSNKIFIITIELLSVLEIMRHSKDILRKQKTTVRSLNIRLESLNKIVNKYELIDDWDEIKDLIIEENNKIERKSTFFTPIEQHFIDKETDLKIWENIFDKIINTIIWMINTEWWNIIVWLCEHPEKIVRSDIKQNIIIKNKISFYNTFSELEKRWRGLDEIKRYIQDKIKKKTRLNIDQTDSYWKIKSINLFDSQNTENSVSLFKITIEKSKNIIPIKEWSEDKTAISILKRVDGRTIFVDPVIYLK